MFWQNYLSLCNNAGLAPSDVAKKLGLTSASCSGWKNGAVPRDATLAKIADYFGVTVAYLKGEAPPGIEKAPASEAGSEGSSSNDRRILELLNKFSTLPEAQQALVVALVDSLLQGR